MAEIQDNIIFMNGKKRALEKLFSTDNFGYLAVGYKENGNGFYNPDEDNGITDNGFEEIQKTEDSTYQRVPLSPDNVTTDSSTGKVTYRFTAELDLDNIINDTKINQIAITNTQTESGSSDIFAAAVTETFVKNERLALVFVIEFTM